MNRQTDYTPPIFPWDHIIERKSWARAIAAMVLFEKSQRASPRQILRANWPQDDRAALILKAAQSPTDTTSVPGQATAVTQWRSLSPSSAAWKLFDSQLALRLDLTGLQSISLPTIHLNDAAAPPVPVFVGEGAPAPVCQFAWDKAVLGPARKVVVLSVLSEELNAASSPENYASILGRVLSQATNGTIDTVAFDTNPATAIRPAGLLNGIAPIGASSKTDIFAAMAEDLANLVGNIGGKGIDPADTVFIAPPREAMMIKLYAGPKFDHDVLSTLGLPAKTVMAVSPAGIASGYQGPPTIETSSSAEIHMEDTAPGSPTSTPSRSLLQSATIGVKVRAWAAWAAYPGAVQVCGSVAW